MGEEERDELDEFIARRTTKNPAFSAMVEAARQQRALEREADARCERLGYTEQGIADPARSNAGRLLPRAKRAARRSGARATSERR
ncbi:MAG: hypothetical protein U0232_22170 [Thermomicrobiales bacterium]